MIRYEEFTLFKYLELNIEHRSGFISIEQNAYMDELSEVEITKESDSSKHAQLNNNKARQVGGLTEQLNCVPSQKRLDVSYYACETSVSDKNATFRHLIQAIKT